ncbi:MAG: hypothetical protein ACLUUD_11200 [Phascolarctobacterium succinatutens]|uniref:hypothetical protein n=1 Tax=Phascolarctobacterium succinatutens TaxID=626940 RepID=UPI003991D1C4
MQKILKQYFSRPARRGVFFTQKQALAILFLPYLLSYTILTKFFGSSIVDVTTKMFFRNDGDKIQKINFHKNDNTEQKCEPDYITAHEYCMFNRRLLEHDKRCGCFHCLKVFDTKELEWVDFGLTALCPYCGIDAVIGESAGYPLTEEFLKKMRDYWFSC